MKKRIITLSLCVLTSGCLIADWKENYKKWSKDEANALKNEQLNKYDISKYTNIPSGVSDTINDVNNGLNTIGAIADKYGFGEEVGGLIGEAQSVMSMANNENYSKLLQSTGLELLGAVDSGLVEICYEKVGGFKAPSMPDLKMPEIKLDPCIKFDTGFEGVNVCSSLPDIPGYVKKSNRILETETKQVEMFCGDWKENGIIKTTTIQEKVLHNDSSKSVSDSVKIAENTDVTEKIKRTKVTDVGVVSNYKFERTKVDSTGNVVKNSKGEPIKEIVQPMKGLNEQNTPEQKNAYKLVKKTLERKAAEGASAGEIEDLRRDLVANSHKLNVAYKTEHEYILARNEAIDKLHFIEKDVYDTYSEIELFKTQVIKYENDIKDVSARVMAIKNEKENFVLQYKKRIEKWLKVKENYYFEYEKKGIIAPTAYYVNAVTADLTGEELSIKRAALVQQIDNEMNYDVQHISKMRVEAQKLVNKFIAKLDIEIIANRKFDLQGAMESVGLNNN